MILTLVAAARPLEAATIAVDLPRAYRTRAAILLCLPLCWSHVEEQTQQ